MSVRTCNISYSVPELLAHSLAIEAEAQERYTQLAEQMEIHNNHEVAGLFRRLAEIEGKHVDQVHNVAGSTPIPHVAPWDLHWQGSDSPEAPELGDVHYLMTPHHALTLALRGERQAVEFFAEVAKSAEDETVRHMAAALAEEEREHVALVEAWLANYPEPDADWAEDQDPPNQE